MRYMDIHLYICISLKSILTRTQACLNQHKIQVRNWRGGGHPCPFSKIGKKCPNLEKKCPDRGHL